MGSAREGKVYGGEVNLALMSLLEGRAVRRVLDVGCGAGANAAWIRQRFPGAHVTGISISAAEAEQARANVDEVIVCDLEQGLPPALSGLQFDTVILSHVLEHLREPALLLGRLAPHMAVSGCMLIAVPNVLGWRQRVRFLRGDFAYAESGVLDATHLRFFTYLTAEGLLLSQLPQARLSFRGADGTVPLWWFRRYILPGSWSRRIDEAGCRWFPNLFGSQVLLRVEL